MAFLDELIVNIDPLPKKVVLDHGEVIVIFRDGSYFSMARGKATRINLKLPIYGKTTGIKFDLLTGSHEVTLRDVVLPNSGTADGEPQEARVTVDVSAQVSLNTNEGSVREWVEEFRLRRIDSGAALKQTFERTIRDYLREISYEEARQGRFDLDELVQTSAGTFLQIHRIDSLDVGPDERIERARAVAIKGKIEAAEERVKEDRERARLVAQRETERQTGISVWIRDKELFDRVERIATKALEHEREVGNRKATLLAALIKQLEDVRDIAELSKSPFVQELLALDDSRTNQTTAALRELILPPVVEDGSVKELAEGGSGRTLERQPSFPKDETQSVPRLDRWRRPSELARDARLDEVVSDLQTELEIRGSCIAPAADPNSNVDWAYVVTAAGSEGDADGLRIQEMEDALGVDRVLFLADDPTSETLLKNWLSFLAGEELHVVRASGEKGGLRIEVEAATHEPDLAKALEAASPAVGRLLNLDEVTIELA